MSDEIPRILSVANQANLETQRTLQAAAEAIATSRAVVAATKRLSAGIQRRQAEVAKMQKDIGQWDVVAECQAPPENQPE